MLLYIIAYFYENGNTTLKSTDHEGWRKIAFTEQLNNVEILTSNNSVDLVSGEQYVFSIMCRTDGTFDCKMSLYTILFGHNTMPVAIYKLNDTLYKIECMFTAPYSLGHRFVDFKEFTTQNATYVEFRYPCLKQGSNVSSEYSPSPYDFVQPKDVISSINITPGEIKIDANKINLKGSVTADDINVDDLKALGATIAGWEIVDRYIQKFSLIGDNRYCQTVIESPTKSSNWFLWSKVVAKDSKSISFKFSCTNSISLPSE